MPIQLAPLHKEMKITRLVIKDDATRKRLIALGIVRGASISVLAHRKGAVVVLIAGARLALNEDVASHIFVA